ncbi:MAG: HAD family hydrolase [Planctomycetota bacterium]
MLDTLDDLANSMNAALTRLGFPTHPTDSFRYFIGSGVDYLANCVLPKDNLDGPTITKCMAAYRDEYREHFADNTKPYPGIPELLSTLAERNIPQVILSNKPDEFTQIIVEKLLPRCSFQIVRGAGPSVPPKPDPAAALQIANELKIPPPLFLYLGDTNTDMQTANSAGMYAAGALWGFRTAEELRENGAKTLVESPQDVLRLLD